MNAKCILTPSKLFAEFDAMSEPFPYWDPDGSIWLFGDSLDCCAGERGRIDRHVVLDDESQTITCEAYCPNWRVDDLDSALRYANEWSYKHDPEKLLIDMWKTRLVWRKVVAFGEVTDEAMLDEFSERELIAMVCDSSSCLEDAYCELEHNPYYGNRNPKEADKQDNGQPPPQQGEIAEELAF